MNIKTGGHSQNHTVIVASSDVKARAFEEQSSKKRFYPDGVYCWGDSCALLITISTEGNIQDHNVLLNRHNYINMGTSQNSPASKHMKNAFTLTANNNINEL